MRWKRLGALALGATAAGACLSAPRPFEAKSHLSSQEEPTDALARALETLGQPPVEVNRTFALVRTRWDVSDYPHGEVGGEPAVVVRRYLASWQGARDGVAVRLELQLLACAKGSVQVVESGSEVKGACVALERGVPDPFQAELDRLGPQLAWALEHPGAAAAPGP